MTAIGKDAGGWTPGPWSKHDCFDPTGKRLTSRDIVPRSGHSLSGVVVLASVFSNEHDALLIAAAPELYEALRTARGQVVALMLECGHSPEVAVANVSGADAALAKARPESAQ